jgi:hypothetical protein
MFLTTTAGTLNLSWINPTLNSAASTMSSLNLSRCISIKKQTVSLPAATGVHTTMNVIAVKTATRNFGISTIAANDFADLYLTLTQCIKSCNGNNSGRRTSIITSEVFNNNAQHGGANAYEMSPGSAPRNSLNKYITYSKGVGGSNSRRGSRGNVSVASSDGGEGADGRFMIRNPLDHLALSCDSPDPVLESGSDLIEMDMEAGTKDGVLDIDTSDEEHDDHDPNEESAETHSDSEYHVYDSDNQGPSVTTDADYALESSRSESESGSPPKMRDDDHLNSKITLLQAGGFSSFKKVSSRKGGGGSFSSLGGSRTGSITSTSGGRGRGSFSNARRVSTKTQSVWHSYVQQNAAVSASESVPEVAEDKDDDSAREEVPPPPPPPPAGVPLT